MNWLLLLLAMQIGQAQIDYCDVAKCVREGEMFVTSFCGAAPPICYTRSGDKLFDDPCPGHKLRRVEPQSCTLFLPISGRHSYDWMPLAQPDNPFVISQMTPMDVDACKGGVYKNGVCLMPASTEWPAQDVPAIQEQRLIHKAGESMDCGLNYCFTPVDIFEPRPACKDKSRILLTAEDGTKHCIKF